MPNSKHDTILGFGKYRGKALHTLPSDYLLWVSENLGFGLLESNWMTKTEVDRLISEADEEIAYRELHNIHWKFEE